MTIEWILFNIFVVLFLIGGLFFQKGDKKVSGLKATLWSILWIVLALLFSVYLYFTHGKDKSIDFLTGYLIEKLLSLDNLFVFYLIFQYFRTPPHLLPRVLFWGIFGAIIMRAAFIFLGIAVLETFHFTLYLFGAFLIYLGIKFCFFEKKEIDLEKNWVLKLYKKFFPVISGYSGHNFFIMENGRLHATTLFVVLLAIESTDLIFAVDSVPAVLAITTDPFIVYTAIIFALFGLRSLFFLLVNLADKVKYFHYGVGIILALVGVKMVASDFIKIPAYYFLASIVFIMAAATFISFFPKSPRS